MEYQKQHAVLPKSSHDQMARQNFLTVMREQIMGPLRSANKDVYRDRLLPAYQCEHGRVPKSRREVQLLLNDDPYYQVWSAVHRTIQEILWDEVGETIETQLPKLVERAKAAGETYGSIRIDPKLVMPKYMSAVDIHVMPGNFQTELMPEDVYAGALYDRGVFIYSMGRRGPLGQGMGEDTVAFIKDTFPQFSPKGILEVGCSVGHALLAFVDGFQKAEVYGIDVSAPMIRYAHARAESLGKAIHLSQQNACQTDFEDDSFDLIVSHLLIHEMPVKEIRAMYREIGRILRPGGIMLEGESVYQRSPELIEQTLGDWYAHYNNEPFQYAAGELDFLAETRSAGLHPDAKLFNERGVRIAFGVKG